MSNLGYDPDTPRRDFEFNLHRDIDRYTDSDDSMSIQDLAVMRGHEAGDEDLHDYDEETYNQMIMDEGDF